MTKQEVPPGSAYSGWRSGNGTERIDRWLLLTSAAVTLVAFQSEAPEVRNVAILASLLVIGMAIVGAFGRTRRPALPWEDRRPPDEPETEGTEGETAEMSWRSCVDGQQWRIPFRVDSALARQRRSVNPTSRGSVPLEHWERTAREILDVGADDPPVVMVAQHLLRETRARRFNYFEEAQTALQFVQAFPYKTDQDSVGLFDYWRFPVETLVDGVGDCECKALLAAGVFRHMGLRSIVLLSHEEEHAAIAVEGAPDYPGSHYFEHDGGKYYFCETTSGTDGFTVGQIPPGVDINGRYAHRVVVEHWNYDQRARS